MAPAYANNPYAVRALAPASGSPTGGISSRLPARSLQDWEVEDLVLLATVDGVIHARDRKTGSPRWAVEADRPMVETIYHKTNDSAGSQDRLSEFIWIVEPSQDGALYGYAPGSPLGIQRLGLTVKKLVEDESPQMTEDPPVAYTAEKKNTLYTVDAATGKILKIFSAAGSSVVDEGSCSPDGFVHCRQAPGRPRGPSRRRIVLLGGTRGPKSHGYLATAYVGRNLPGTQIFIRVFFRS